MKLKKIYAYAACAIALFVGYNSATYAMDADAERIAQTRASAQKLGVAAPDDASITDAVRDGYVAARKVHKFYTNIRSERVSALPDTTSADWERLAIEASQDRFSPLFQAILDRFIELDRFNTVPRDTFLPRADSYDPSINPLRYTPSVVADCLESFIDDTNKFYDLNKKLGILSAFLDYIAEEIPADFERHIRELNMPTAAVELPENRDSLQEVLDRKKSVPEALQPLLSYLSFGEKVLSTRSSSSEQLAVLREHIPQLHTLARKIPDFELHNARLRDFIYACALCDDDSTTKVAALQADASFREFGRLTGGKALFLEHDDQGTTSVDADQRYQKATELVHEVSGATLPLPLVPHYNDLIALKDKALIKLKEQEGWLMAILTDMACTYRDIQYAKQRS